MGCPGEEKFFCLETNQTPAVEIFLDFRRLVSGWFPGKKIFLHQGGIIPKNLHQKIHTNNLINKFMVNKNFFARKLTRHQLPK